MKTFSRVLFNLINLLILNKSCCQRQLSNLASDLEREENRKLVESTEKVATSYQSRNDVLRTNMPITNPSAYHTITPTFNPTHDKPSSKFSYNPYAKHGPDNWDKVKVRNNEYREFQKLSVTENQCDKGGQSPIDLHPNAKCIEHHQIRTKRGDFNFNESEFKILPNALRVEFPRAIRGNVTTVRVPPQADFSNGWPSCDAKHLEIKVPSEHRIYGKQYDGELSINHIIKKRVINIAVMLDSTKNIHSKKIQAFLDEWEEEFDKMKARCKIERKLMQGKNITTTYQRTRPRKTKEELAEIFGMDDDWDRSRQLSPIELANTADYPVYRIFPTVWFFGYAGSFTAPPCSNIVHWRVLEAPIDISVYQLSRIKHIINAQVDRKCRRTTAAYFGRVNRPIQDLENRDVWHCTDKNYIPDIIEEWQDLKPAYFPERNY